MRVGTFLIVLITMVTSLSGCAVFNRDADGIWTLQESSVDGETLGPAPQQPVTLEVSSGALIGDAGCNAYGIEADVYGGSIDLYPDREITEEECSPAVMRVEQEYWDALQRVSIYSIEGDTLELEGQDVFLTFHRSG